MSKGTINITVSDSTATFGTVHQGDHGNISTSNNSTIAEKNSNFDNFYSQLRDFEPASLENGCELDELKTEIKSLQSALNQNSKDKDNNLMKKMKWLYETYGWAAVPLKNLFDTLLPRWQSV